MKEQIKRTLTIQKAAFLGVWTAPLLLVALYETGVFQKGIHECNVQMEYIFQCVSILLTIIMIPFSLRIFNLNLVKRIQELPLQQALSDAARRAGDNLKILRDGVHPALAGAQIISDQWLKTVEL